MRIIHFSDIHAGGMVKSLGGLFDKRLLGMGNHVFRRMWKRRWERVDRAVMKIRALDPDVVVFTGDLSTLSEPSEFSQAKASLKPLVDDSRFELLAIPGNHDHYVRSKACAHALDDAIRYLSRDRWGVNELPLAKIVETVRFVMVNQACPVAPWLSSGRLSKETLAFLDRELTTRSENPTFLLSHFPILDRNGRELSWRRSCVNNEPLKRALTEGVIDVALCGHVHTPFLRKESSGAVEICAGSLSFYGKMNMIDYQPATKEYVQSWIDVDDIEVATQTPSAATAFSS